MFEIKLSIAQLLHATCGTLYGPFSAFPMSSLRTTFIQSIFTDSREETRESLFVALPGERFDGHDFLHVAVAHGAKLFCIEKDRCSCLPPGTNALLVNSTVRAFQDIARYHRMRLRNLTAIMLTGSCGKTSTKEALRAIFDYALGAEYVLATEGNTNNQIGVPQNLLCLTERHKIAIIEAGTNHHGEIEPLSKCIMPDVGIITSIAHCHLEFLGSLEGVASEKSFVFSHIRKKAPTAVIPESCPGNSIIRNASRYCKQITFGDDDASSDYHVKYLGGNLLGASFLLTEKQTGDHITVQWPVPGKHQARNAAAAIAAARSLGVSLSDCATGLANTKLPGLRARTTVHNGSVWINDAYNANPDSMSASLHWLAEFVEPMKLVLVLGDMGELGKAAKEGHRNVCSLASELFPDSHLLLIGPQMQKAAESLNLHAECFQNAASAVKKIRSIPPGFTIFLKASRSMGLECVEPDTNAAQKASK